MIKETEQSDRMKSSMFRFSFEFSKQVGQVAFRS